MPCGRGHHHRVAVFHHHDRGRVDAQQSVQHSVLVPGRYTIYVANSADNTPRTATLTAE
jgi:hypothetical protein